MKRATWLGLCAGLLVVLAGASQAAALPGYYVCAKKALGLYKNSKCTVISELGKYELVPLQAGAGKPITFTLKGKDPTIEGWEETAFKVYANKVDIACEKLEGSGTVVAAPSGVEEVKLKFEDCKPVGTVKKCWSAGGEAKGDISTLELLGPLGYIEKPKVGIGLTRNEVPVPILASFECGVPMVEETPYHLDMGVIGELTPVKEVTKDFKLNYAAKEGEQLPEAFEEPAGEVRLGLEEGVKKWLGTLVAKDIELKMSEDIDIQ